MSVDTPRLLLPETLDNGPAAPDAAEWHRHEGGLISLSQYSSALKIQDTGTTAQELRSIPTPWARLLLFEHALYNKDHPARESLLPEWRGLMALIGLSEYLGLDLEVHRVLLPSAAQLVEPGRLPTNGKNGAAARIASEMTRGSSSNVMGVLRSLAPEEEIKDLWDYHGLITVNGKLVGGTSPRTLCFTGVRSTPEDVPFRRTGRLVDPVEHYSGADGREPLSVLAKWVSDTLGLLEARRTALGVFLGRQPASASTNPVWRADLLLVELRAWEKEIAEALAALGGPLAQSAGMPGRSPFVGVFPDEHPGALILGELRPISYDSQDERNDLRFGARGLVADPGAQGLVLKDGKPYTGHVRLPRGRTVRVEGGRPLVRISTLEPEAIDFTGFFAPSLVPVLDVRDEHVTLLRCGGDRFLFPFGREILQQLDEAPLRTHTVARRDRGAVTVQLEVEAEHGFSIRYEVGYPGQNVLAGHSAPTLALWPNFRSAHWSRYFYVVQQIASGDVLKLEALGAELTAYHHDEDSGTTWAEMPVYPSAWAAGANGSSHGLLFTRPAESAPSLKSEWNIAIDFGSTHTRVFRAVVDEAGDSGAQPVRIEPRAVPVLGSPGALAANFFSPVTESGGGRPERRDEPPSTLRFPLGRWIDPAPRARWLPSDGVIFWPSLVGLPEVDGLKADLKWHENDSDDLPAFRSYIAQLYLCVAAEAAAVGARIRSLRTAYPSMFPQHLRMAHARQWSTLGLADGVEVLAPVSESRAVATYLQRERDGTLADNILAIDVGGSTSDLAVWKDYLRAGDSVWLAGDILSRLVASSADARRIVSEAASADPIQQGDRLRWAQDGSAINRLLFNSLLRHVRQAHGSTQVLAQNMDTGKGRGGDWFISHAAYLYAVVSFLMGRMVRRTELRTPRFDLRFVGHGSEFLEWLDVLHPGTSRSLPRTFFLAGLGVKEAEISVQLPGDDVKQEVGRGLLARLVGEPADVERERITFYGESIQAETGSSFEWHQPLSLDSLQSLEKPAEPPETIRLSALNEFVDAFNDDYGATLAARTLAIRSAWTNDNGLRAWIHERLYGPDSPWALSQRMKKVEEMRRGAPSEPDQGLRLEPFFVLEAKALLEHVTANTRLFRSR